MTWTQLLVWSGGLYLVGMMLAWRWLRLPACKCRDFREMTPRAFEREVASLFRQAGYRVRFTPATRDGGVDLYLYRGARDAAAPVAAVECKHWKRPVGSGAIRSFASALQLAGLSEGYLVAPEFSRNAADTVARMEAQSGVRVILVTPCELCAWRGSGLARWWHGLPGRARAKVLIAAWVLVVLAVWGAAAWLTSAGGMS